MDDLVCQTCGKSFPYYKSKNRPTPRFCSHDCRGHTGFVPGGKVRIANLTDEEKMYRLKKSFEKHVIRQEGCWAWKGPIARGGYPVMSCKPAIGPDRGHRASWTIHKGPIPKGLCVCHSCDNPICTNPDHLWVGTGKENNEDKMRKGRRGNSIPHHKRGSDNSSAVLNEEQVVEIKKMLKEKHASRSIGKKYGVSKTNILRIKNNKIWTHVTLPDEE